MTEDPLIGRTIDDTYHITSILGVGGMGVVYKARDVMLEKDVAIKMMDVRLANDADFLKRFQQEAKALAKLQDPNTVAIYTLKKTDVGFCIVMEFVDGCTLADALKENGALPIQRTKQIFQQILKAFSHAHSKGIVHRDIKPSNVMLTADDFVKITDFGLAKIQQPSGATQTMGTGGTLYYMSPEQVRGLANVDLRGDIYSLGMTLYEAATGRLPFTDTDTDFDIREAIVHGKIKSPAEFSPGLPGELVKVITRAINKDPEKRFQNAAEMWEALERVTDGSSAKSLPGGRGERGGASPGSRTRLAVIASVLALVVLAILFYVDAIKPFLGIGSTTLTVDSSPSAASVFINDSLVGQTPLQEVTLNSGVTKIRVAKEGFVSHDTSVYVRKAEGTQVMMSLAAAPATAISIRTQPSGASVAINGEIVGITPLEPYAVGPGTMKVRLVRDSYQADEFDVTLKEGQDTSLVVQLKSLAVASQLVLGVVPSGSISVDGKVQQSGAVDVTAGSHTLLFAHPQYGSKTITVDVRQGETKRLTCYFETSISVNAQPVYGYIWVDGKNTGVTTPAEYSLAPGKHRVTVKRNGYRAEEGERDVVIQPEMNKRIIDMAFSLVPN